MLGAVLSAVNDLRLEQVATPSPGPGEVLLAVGATTLCGTDVRIMRGAKTQGVATPVILGHELAGHIAEVGPGVTEFTPGVAAALMPGIPCRRCWECTHDLENACERLRIVGYSVDGGLAEYVLVPAESIEAGCLFTVEADVGSEALALAEPLACAVTGQHAAPVEVGDTVLIMGAGPIGLLHLQLSRLSGARTVIVSQPGAERRAHADRLGATVTVDPGSEDLAAVVGEHTGGRGVDVAIICAGAVELVNEALLLCRTGGRVNIFAGLPGDGATPLHGNVVHYRQVSLAGSSNTRRRDYRTALDLIASGRVDTAGLVTHRYPLTEVAAAFDRVVAGDGLKVAVLPHGDRDAATPQGRDAP